LFQWYDRNVHLREKLSVINNIEKELKKEGFIK